MQLFGGNNAFTVNCCFFNECCNFCTLNLMSVTKIEHWQLEKTKT